MEKKQKILNIPNQISLFRIFCTPLMIVMFLLPIKNGIGTFVALGLFIIASLSDILDGHIARKYNLVTDFGKLADSLADKFLQTAGLILIATSHVIEPEWVAIVVLLIMVLRDILINGIRQISASKGNVIAADFYGKLKTIFIDVAVVVIMLYIALVGVLPEGDSAKIGAMPIEYILTLGVSILAVGAGLAVLSCVNYTVNNWSSIFSVGDDEAAKAKEQPEIQEAVAMQPVETENQKADESEPAKKTVKKAAKSKTAAKAKTNK